MVYPALIFAILAGLHFTAEAAQEVQCSSIFAQLQLGDRAEAIVLPKGYSPSIRELGRSELTEWNDISKKVGGQFHDKIFTATIKTLPEGTQRVAVKQVSLGVVGGVQEITLEALEKEAKFAQMLSDLKIGPYFHGVIKEKKTVPTPGGGTKEVDSWLFVSEWIDEARLVRHTGGVMENWDLLSTSTAGDLERIAKTFAKNGIQPWDFQYLLTPGGRVIVIDAEKFAHSGSPLTEIEKGLMAMGKTFVAREDLEISPERAALALKLAGLEGSSEESAQKFLRALKRVEWNGARKEYSIDPDLYFKNFLSDLREMQRSAEPNIKNAPIFSRLEFSSRDATRIGPSKIDQDLRRFWAKFFIEIESPLAVEMLSMREPLATRVSRAWAQKDSAFREWSLRVTKQLGKGAALSRKRGNIVSKAWGAEEPTPFGNALLLYPEILPLLRKSASGPEALSIRSMERLAVSRGFKIDTPRWQESMLESLENDQKILNRFHWEGKMEKIDPALEKKLAQRLESLEEIQGSKIYNPQQAILAMAKESGLLEAIERLPREQRVRLYEITRDMAEIFPKASSQDPTQIRSFLRAAYESAGLTSEEVEIGLHLGIFGSSDFPHSYFIIEDLINVYRKKKEPFHSIQ